MRFLNTNSPLPAQLDRRRYIAALSVTGFTVRSVARGAKVSERYVYSVLAGQCRMSNRIKRAMRMAVGPTGWAYATGETDLLPCPGNSTSLQSAEAQAA